MDKIVHHIIILSITYLLSIGFPSYRNMIGYLYLTMSVSIVLIDYIKNWFLSSQLYSVIKFIRLVLKDPTLLIDPTLLFNHLE